MMNKYILLPFFLFLSTTFIELNAQCSAVAPVPNDACYQQVITNDPFCCNNTWDGFCQNAYDDCSGEPPPPPPPPPEGTGCNVQASVCEPGQTQPFAFFPSFGGAGAGNDFAAGTCATGQGGNHDYGYIVLNITQGGPLNLFVNGSSTTGFIDVIVFDVTGQNPCDAVMDASNEIGCNFAFNSSGCVQFGTEFTCPSDVPAPNVQVGDQIMVIVQDWSTQSTSFTLELAPTGAQAGGFDATIDPVNNLEVTDPPAQITAVNNGGSWSASCGPCIDENTGEFDPSIAGDGEHEIYYSIGVPPCDDQDTTIIIVGVPCDLDFDVTTINTSCIGESDGEAFLEIIEGVPPFTFEWNDVANTSDSVVAGLPAGSYQVTVTDDSACVVTQVLVIDDPEPFVIELSSDNALCFEDSSGSTSVVNATGGTPSYSYEWNDADNQTGGNAINLLAGIYEVTLTDDNGCSATDSIEVFEPTSLELELGAEDTECSGGVGNGSAFITSLSGGVGPYTYQWNDSNNQQSDTASNLNTGEYVLTVTDANGCQIADSITIFSPDGVFFTLDADSALCTGSATGTAFIDSISGGTPPYTYQWNDPNNQTTPTATNLVSGTYTLTVTDANDCPVSFNVFVPEPSLLTLVLTGEDVSCFSGIDGAIVTTVSGGSPSYTFLWSNNEITQDINGLEASTYSLTVTDANNCSVTDSIVVGEPNTVVVEFTNQNVSCFGGDDATSTVNIISGGTTPFTYQWNDSQTQATQTATGLEEGNYIVEITDNNGCIFIDSTSIIQPTLLELELDSIQISCFGFSDGSAIANPSGGTQPYLYNWNNNATTSSTTQLSIGEYSVIVTDDNGCQVIDSIEVTQPEALFFSLDFDSVLCFGNATGSAFVDSISGGVAPYAYSWNDANNQSTAIATSLFSGNYTLEVTDANNCTLSNSIEVLEYSEIEINETVIDASCFDGDDGSISINVSGGLAPYSYNWSNAETSQDINSLEAGTFTITVTDANNCTQTKNIEVQQPNNVVIAFDNQNVSCFEGNDGIAIASVESGGTAPFTYQWNDSQNQNTSTATGLESGNYSVVVTDDNGCTYSSTTNISEPTLLTLEITSTPISCEGFDDATITVTADGGTPPYTYEWSNGANTSNIENIGPGDYSVKVIDNNGCEENVIVTIDDPLPISVSVETDSATCWGYDDGVIVVYASGGSNSAEGFLYSIDGGNNFQTSNIFNGLGSGIFPNIIVEDLGSSQNCVSTPVSVTVYHPNPLFATVMPEDTLLELDAPATLMLNVDAALGYTIDDITAVSWSPSDGLSCTDCLTPTVLIYENYITYEAQITYSSGVGVSQCFTDASAIVRVDNNLRFFIPDAFTPNGDGVNDDFRVYGEGFKTVNLLVFNRWGEKLFESFNQFQGWDATYKGELVDPGVYTYFFEGEYLDGKTASKKGSVTVLR